MDQKGRYLTFLRRLCQSKGFSVTNNHALRMSLNSNVLLPMGISVADRAAMLGHSIQTNLQYYSFAQKDYLDNVRQLLDSMGESPEGTPREPLKIIPFSKKGSSEHLISQAFLALIPRAEDGTCDGSTMIEIILPGSIGTLSRALSEVFSSLVRAMGEHLTRSFRV